MLDSTCFRIGLLGALRSKSLGGRVVGLMVTASHNPEPDNGVKMVDAHGEMLAAAWEPACTRVANAASADELMEQLQAIVAEFQIVLKQPARVVYGRDTRPSSPRLAGAIAAGLAAMGAEAIDAGLLTTPQLRTNARHQLFRLKRLIDVIIRAGLQAQDNVDSVGPSTQHHDGHP